MEKNLSETSELEPFTPHESMIYYAVQHCMPRAGNERNECISYLLNSWPIYSEGIKEKIRQVIFDQLNKDLLTQDKTTFSNLLNVLSTLE